MRAAGMLFILILLSVAALAEAADREAKNQNQLLRMIYDMCRGGGYAYEIDKGTPDASCLAKAEAKAAEYPERSERAKKAQDAVNAAYKEHKLSEANAKQKVFSKAFKEKFYFDVCEDYYHGPVGGEIKCSYPDHRLIDGGWEETARALRDLNKEVKEIAEQEFAKNVYLPAHSDGVIRQLTDVGFDCSKGTECKLVTGVFAMKNSEVTRFASLTLIYRFDVVEDKIIKTATITYMDSL